MANRTPVQLGLVPLQAWPVVPRRALLDLASRPVISDEDFRRLGWASPTTHAGDSPGLKTRRKSVTLYASTLRGLLAEVEHSEVARRAKRLEREYTEALAEKLGWTLTRGRRGCWRAERGDTQQVLEAGSAEGLRDLLRALTRPDPAPELPWANPEDAQEVPHGS